MVLISIKTQLRRPGLLARPALLLAKRIGAVEEALLGAESDPARRAWIRARRELGLEVRLYSYWCYTDVSIFLIVGAALTGLILEQWGLLTRQA